MDWARLRHWPGNLSVITPRRGGTEHGFFREDGLWPRSPRNFATEQCIFYNAMRTVDEGEVAQFSVEFDISAIAGNVYIGPFTGYFIYGTSLRPRVMTTLSGVAGYYDLFGGASGFITVSIGDHIKVEYSLVSTTLTGTLYINDVLSETVTKTIAEGTEFSYLANTTNAYIYNLAAVLEDANGTKLWSYPSESERLRLYTTDGNVIAGDRYFEAANPAVAARIDSQIDLRGVVSDYTVAVDFEAAEFSANSQKQELTGQGAAVAANIAPAICSLAYARASATSYILQLSQEVAGARNAVFYERSTPITGRHTCAGSIAIKDGMTRFCIYLDGVLVKSDLKMGSPMGIAYSGMNNFAVNDARGGTWTNFFGKFYAAALFNRALSDSQINLLSH